MQRAHETLERGAKHGGRYLELLDHPQDLYAAAPDEQRCEPNTASFEVLRLDEDGFPSDRKTPLIEELREIGTSYVELQQQKPESEEPGSAA